MTTSMFFFAISMISDIRFLSFFSISNDTSGAWVSSGFGTTENLNQPKFYIPAQIAASGIYVSGSGRAYLECSSDNQIVTLKLVSD